MDSFYIKEKIMDAMKIIKRAWAILWSYRTLWIFGFILALTVGGSTYNRLGSNSSYQYNNNKNIQNTIPFQWNDQTFQDPQHFLEAMRTAGSSLTEALGSVPAVGTLVGFLIAFFILVFLVGIGMTFLRYVSETAVIRMVDDYESTGQKVTYKQGFRLGWSPAAWRLFLIDLLIGFLPGLILFIILGSLAWGVVSMLINNGIVGGQVAVIALMAGIGFLFILLFSLYSVLVGLLRNFFVRTAALEQVGVGDAIRQGYALARRNWKNVGLFWLVMIGLSIAWAIVSIVLVILLIPFFIASVILGVVVAGIPGLLIGLFSSLFVQGYWPVVIGALFGLPLFIPLVASPLLFVEGLAQVFRSTVWTLVYRELKVVQPAIEVIDEVLPAPGD
jgi:hypothetical protein